MRGRIDSPKAIEREEAACEQSSMTETCQTTRCTTTASAELEALERAQEKALRASSAMPGFGSTVGADGSIDDAEQMSKRVRLALATVERAGFDVIGAGSTRIVVKLKDGTAAKCAYTHLGLAHNFQEASLWLALPERVREHMAPSLLLSARLVLVQACGEGVTPGLPDYLPATPGRKEKLRAQEAAALNLYSDRLAACRHGLGFTRPLTPANRLHLRLDNFVVHGGRIVAVDYCEKFRAIPSAWAWLWHQWTASHRPLALTPDARDRFYASKAAFASAKLPSLFDLAARAGAAKKNGPSDASCPCLRAFKCIGRPVAGGCDRDCRFAAEPATETALAFFGAQIDDQPGRSAPPPSDDPAEQCAQEAGMWA